MEWLVLSADECVKHKASSLKHKEESYYTDAASRNTFQLPFLSVVSTQAGEGSRDVRENHPGAGPAAPLPVLGT